MPLAAPSSKNEAIGESSAAAILRSVSIDGFARSSSTWLINPRETPAALASSALDSPRSVRTARIRDPRDMLASGAGGRDLWLLRQPALDAAHLRVDLGRQEHDL